MLRRRERPRGGKIQVEIIGAEWGVAPLPRKLGLVAPRKWNWERS